MHYEEFQPSPALRPFVDRLWLLEGSPETIADDPVLPDGHAEIIVHAGEPFAEVAADGSARTQGRLLFSGQLSRAVRLRPHGASRVVGARLRSHAAFAFCRVPQQHLTDRIVDLRDIHQRLARVLQDDVVGRETREGLVSAFDCALRRMAPSSADTSATVWAVNLALKRQGLVRVDELARAVDLSPRQLERVFRDRVGLAPKQFLRVVRFQEVLGAIRQGSEPRRWADVAVACGYYDQAHFIHDFKAFTGQSPGEWNVTDASLTAIFSAIRRQPVD